MYVQGQVVGYAAQITETAIHTEQSCKFYLRIRTALSALERLDRKIPGFQLRFLGLSSCPKSPIQAPQGTQSYLRPAPPSLCSAGLRPICSQGPVPLGGCPFLLKTTGVRVQVAGPVRGFLISKQHTWKRAAGEVAHESAKHSVCLWERPSHC